MATVQAAITGIAAFTPEYKLTNQELEKMVDTNDEWITTRTGIKERRILKDKDKASAYMGAEAVKKLLAKTNTKPEEIDMLICATATPDYIFPATANLITKAVGANNAFGYDLQAACSGFLYSLVIASQFIKAGTLKKIVVVGTDKMSSVVNYKDRTTCIIFGDGGAAVLLEPDYEGNGIIDFKLGSDGAGEPYLHMKAGGSRKPASHETVDNEEHYIYQEGQTVFKYAVTQMAEVAAEVMERNQLTSDMIAWLAPHQANIRIIDATARRMNLPKEKVMITIDHYGNTTNASIPLCLWENEHKLKKGDNIMLAAFGAGFTWGAVYLKWAYNGNEVNSN